jgi:hypothetical protein
MSQRVSMSGRRPSERSVLSELLHTSQRGANDGSGLRPVGASGEGSTASADQSEAAVRRSLGQTRAMLAARATSIYDLYIVDGSTRQINIPAVLSDTVSREVGAGSVDPQLFDDCMLEVYRLMERDTYRRFVKSDDFVGLRLDLAATYLGSCLALGMGDEAAPVPLDERGEIDVNKAEARWIERFSPPRGLSGDSADRPEGAAGSGVEGEGFATTTAATDAEVSPEIELSIQHGLPGLRSLDESGKTCLLAAASSNAMKRPEGAKPEGRVPSLTWVSRHSQARAAPALGRDASALSEPPPSSKLRGRDRSRSAVSAATLPPRFSDRHAATCTPRPRR